MNWSRWLCTLLCLGATAAWSQTTTFGVRGQSLYSLAYNGRYDPALNGGGLQVEWARSGSNRIGWVAGAEVGYTGWGNQVLAKAGVQYVVTDTRRWHSSARAYVMPGAALFRPSLLVTYRTGVEITVTYQFTKRLGILLGTGVAYSACPRYADYGTINRYVDVPVALGFQWRRE